MLQLQRNIPPPKSHQVKPGDKRKKYPVESMQTGDFFFVEGKVHSSIRTYFSTLGKQHGVRLTSKQIHARRNELEQWVECPEDTPGAVMGVGVWCVG